MDTQKITQEPTTGAAAPTTNGHTPRPLVWIEHNDENTPVAYIAIDKRRLPLTVGAGRPPRGHFPVEDFLEGTKELLHHIIAGHAFEDPDDPGDIATREIGEIITEHFGLSDLESQTRQALASDDRAQVTALLSLVKQARAYVSDTQDIAAVWEASLDKASRRLEESTPISEEDGDEGDDGE